MKKIIFILILSFITFNSRIYAQQVIEIEPLFEYPVAPDEMESLEDRCAYLVKNFWDNFNFKTSDSVDQYALNEAFQVYASTFSYAPAKDVDQSIDKLIKNISNKPVLQLQFTKAAEENLYGPRAQIWSDQLFLKFIDAVLKNKKIPAARKTRYEKLATALRESAIGQRAPEFWFTDRERASKRYFPMSTPTILIFGNPDDTDWRLTRLKMDSNFTLDEALKKGKINILYILPSEVNNWKETTANYNPLWTVGVSEEAAKVYDIKVNPAIYIVGADGKILNKNIIPQEAVEKTLDLVK